MTEGVSALDDAISFLKRQRPIHNLTFNENLSEVAVDKLSHLSYLYSKSSDNNDYCLSGNELNSFIQKRVEWEECCSETIINSHDNARDAILSIIIDDGENSRKNRNNLFKEEYNYI